MGTTEVPQRIPLNIPAFLACKRRGERWSAPDLHAWSRAIAEGSAADCQIGAFTMAACLAGMDSAETVAWTKAVRDSGDILGWPELTARGPVLDKHSTGGVGDCVSLVLAPMLAACGGFVPMISGRGLGHTGGTLDKLAVLPGYAIEVDAARLKRVVMDTGMAIVSAGASLAPSDRRVYAVRDVTATVDSLPLMVASILGKKLAACADALVLDVKQGSGAMLTEPQQAMQLAQMLVDVANQAGLRCTALITDMQEPLAPAVGNALELDLCLAYLHGEARPSRLHEVSIALGAELLATSGLELSREQAQARLLRALDSGDAAECFARSVAALGGPRDVFAWRRTGVEQAPVRRTMYAQAQGFVDQLDARLIGEVAVDLGAGRRHPDQVIDPWVGLQLAVQRGDWVEPGQPLCEVHARDTAAADQAVAALQRALSLSDTAPVTATIVDRVETPGMPTVARWGGNAA